MTLAALPSDAHRSEMGLPVPGPVCRCGAGPHPQLPQRCAAGHVLVGHQVTTITGSRSVAFWAEHEAARRELRDTVLQDAGHTPADAPRALIAAADSLAMAILVRDAAYDRLVEAGGPLTSSAKTRRCYEVWASSVDRVERYIRLLGLKRQPKPAATLAQVLDGDAP